MKGEFKHSEVEKAVEQMMKAMGLNIYEDRFKGTPARVVKYWAELLEGEKYTNDDIVDMFKTKLYDAGKSTEIVRINDIPIFSHCEHHFALMYDGSVDISYKPKDKVLGLSKFNRICNLVSRRFQLQERLTSDIAYIVKKLTDAEYVSVEVRMKHACVTARGIKSDSDTFTRATL